MICPECRYENIQGADYCANCGHDLRGYDQPDQPGGPERGPAFIYEHLENLVRRQPPRVSLKDPVGLAVRLMQDQQTDCVLVMKGNVLAGIITPWDILHKVAGSNEDLNAFTCGNMMTPDPVCLSPDDDVAVALNTMASGGFRHIPLVVNGAPIAVVSIDDLYHYLTPFLL